MTDTAQPIGAFLAAVKVALAVPSVTALALGGIYNDLPQAPIYPCLRLWGRGKPIGGFGGHRVWDADVEVWIYSMYAGDSEAVAISEAVSTILHFGSLTLDGWTASIVTLDDMYPAGDEELNGRKVKTWVLAFRARLERG